MAGQVKVNNHTEYRSGHRIDTKASIEIVEREQYVSRGGNKLERALAQFSLDPTAKVCLDIGSSTGGFTDCLLQHGALRVHCVDVGKGQLDWQLRNDDRVVVHEGINARYLAFEDIGEELAVATIDVSFISLRLILPRLAKVVSNEGDIIALIKPQFEAGRANVGKGGIVRDKGVHLSVLESIQRFSSQQTRWRAINADYSPILGSAGNIEFLFHLRQDTVPAKDLDLDRLVESAHEKLTSD